MRQPARVALKRCALVGGRMTYSSSTVMFAADPGLMPTSARDSCLPGPLSDYHVVLWRRAYELEVIKDAFTIVGVLEIHKSAHKNARSPCPVSHA